jgi:hypothetical protein
MPTSGCAGAMRVHNNQIGLFSKRGWLTGITRGDLVLPVPTHRFPACLQTPPEFFMSETWPAGNS